MHFMNTNKTTAITIAAVVVLATTYFVMQPRTESEVPSADMPVPGSSVSDTDVTNGMPVPGSTVPEMVVE